MTVGNRIFSSSWSRVPHLVAALSRIPVANISDSMSRLAAAGCGLRPYHNGARLAGQAITVKARPGDNLFVHEAIAMAEEGDVIVVDAGGDLSNAIIGEFMISYAVDKKLGGFVIDGAVRDLGAISKGALPVYAAGISHRGPYKDGPGEINVPIRVGSLVVRPGDLVLGDEDGVLAIPIDDAEEVLKGALVKQAAESRLWDEVRAGTNDRTWLHKKLKSIGTTWID